MAKMGKVEKVFYEENKDYIRSIKQKEFSRKIIVRLKNENGLILALYEYGMGKRDELIIDYDKSVFVKGDFIVDIGNKTKEEILNTDNKLIQNLLKKGYTYEDMKRGDVLIEHKSSSTKVLCEIWAVKSKGQLEKLLLCENGIDGYNKGSQKLERISHDIFTQKILKEFKDNNVVICDENSEIYLPSKDFILESSVSLKNDRNRRELGIMRWCIKFKFI